MECKHEWENKGYVDLCNDHIAPGRLYECIKCGIQKKVLVNCANHGIELYRIQKHNKWRMLWELF